MRRPGGGALFRRIPADELLPPEAKYRPRPHSGPGLISTFFFVFVIVMATLWFTTSLWPLFLLIVIFFSQTFYRRSSQMSAVKQNQHAVNLLNAGRIEEAAAIFEELAESERNTAAHAVYVFNRAVTFMLQGRLKRAFSLFNAVRKSRHFSRGAAHNYEPLMYIEMGSCMALMGMLDEARQYRDRAARLLDESEIGRLSFLEAVIDIRRGDYVRAARRTRSNWRAAEGLLRVPTLKALRLLQAFALWRANATDDRDFRGLIEGVRPFRPGEFDWIGAEWPEFRHFLQHFGLR